MRGKVPDEGVPILTSTVAGQDWTTVIDTGFNGDLELPNELRDLVQPRFKGQFRSLLAGGRTILENTFEVQFPFDGQTVIAEATLTNSSEILLGTGMLRRHRLGINFPKQSVTLNRVKPT